MTLREKIGIAATTATVFASLWAGIIYAVDYEQSLVKTPQLQSMMKQNQQSIDDIKRDTLESKLFELDLVEAPTKAQKALRSYYQNKLDRITDKKGK